MDFLGISFTLFYIFSHDIMTSPWINVMLFGKPVREIQKPAIETKVEQKLRKPSMDWTLIDNSDSEEEYEKSEFIMEEIII